MWLMDVVVDLVDS